MRVFFHSTAISLHSHTDGFPASNGTVPPLHPTINQWRSAFDTTGNRGNMIHAEAIMRLLDRNVNRSVAGNLGRARQVLGDRFADEMRRNFDVVVLSMANCVSKNRDPSVLVAALRELEVPVYVFGVGMQTSLPEGAIDELSPATQDLIREFAKAEYFSVRGEKTAAWLRSVGCAPHTVGGCPSLYAFPSRISRVDYSRVPDVARLVTGGYIAEQNLDDSRPKFRRGRAIVRVFRNTPAAYVMQGEPFSYAGLVDEPGVFDAALSQLDAERLNRYVAERFNVQLPFNRYFFFDQPSTWRQAMSTYGAFIGDRFHGGIACLQASVPAAFIATDQRMRELCEYFAFPHTAFGDIGDGGVEEAIPALFTADANDQFHERYRTRLTAFRRDMADAGLSLADNRSIDDLLSSP